MKESMDFKTFAVKCREQKGGWICAEIGSTPLAQWWRETRSAYEMTWILQKIVGRWLTASECIALKRQPLVEFSESLVIESLVAYANGGPNKAGRYRRFQEMLAFESWAKANALRAVVGNPFESQRESEG